MSTVEKTGGGSRKLIPLEYLEVSGFLSTSFSRSRWSLTYLFGEVLLRPIVR